MRRLVLAATVIVAPMTAGAADLPRYDPDGYCSKVAEAIGGSARIKNTCVGQEQEAYDALKAGWAEIPPKAAGYCDTVARAIGGSYRILATCIRQETEASAEAKPFQF